MKRVNRVKKHQEFTDIIHQHNCVRGQLTNVYFSQRPERIARVGISVGKRNGGAVDRVKIKRQVRAICDEALPKDLPLDIIITIRPEYKPPMFDEIKKELFAAFKSIGEQNIEK